MNTRNAAKAFIFYQGKLLLLKRRGNDIQMPGIWEVPGGRLEEGEGPIEGLKREVREETGLEIEVKIPFNVNYFTRADGQTITMLVYLCKAFGDRVVLSEEHPEYKWVEIEKAKEEINEYFHKEIDVIQKFGLLKYIK